MWLMAAAGPGLWGPSDPVTWIGSWQKAMFASVCHQDLQRSIWLGGSPMAVCDRCFGIYSGLVVGLVLAFRHAPPVPWLKAAAIAAIVLMAVDVGGTSVGLWSAIRPYRLLTGLALGCAGGFLLVSWRYPLPSKSIPRPHGAYQQTRISE